VKTKEPRIDWYMSDRKPKQVMEYPTHPARRVLDLTPRERTRLRQDSPAKAAA
jgi:hypothetical protein